MPMPMIQFPVNCTCTLVYSVVCVFIQMTRNILTEIAMLSTLDPHQRIVAYHGASYRSHPIFKEEYLFIVTEFMEGVS